MALETFNWCARVNASGEIKFATRKAQFGDGYSQVAGDGINNRGQQWDLEFVGDQKTITAISDFLDRHGGFKSFQWKNPYGLLNLYRCDSYKTSALGGGNFSLNASFMQAFGV